MREINVSTLTDVIERLCIEANEHLPEDVKMRDPRLPCLRGWRDRTGSS